MGIRRFFFRESCENGPSPVSRRHKIAVAFIIILAVCSQLWGIGNRYVLQLETGFQELIARRHIDPGLGMTYGISTINNVFGGESILHANHPPLLQLVLAFFYLIFGDSERTSRLIPLISFILAMAGLWRLTRGGISPWARIATVAVYAAAPLSFHSGRIVNFESPTLACIIWTAALIRELPDKANLRRWLVLGCIVAAGSLIDWPYPLFLTSLLLVSFLHGKEIRYHRNALFRAWILSMVVCMCYVSIVYSAGAFDIFVHHIKIQTGAYTPVEGLQPPPVLTGWTWWWSLLKRTATYGTPVLMLSSFFWLGWIVLKKQWGDGLHNICLAFTVFFLSYVIIFSRASFNHLWSLFYSMPFLCLAFGLLVDRLRRIPSLLLLAAVIAFSLPVTYQLRSKQLLLPSSQFGRVIASATEFLPRQNRTYMNGPLLYTSRVDPLPYYAGCETAFFHLAVAAHPRRFLIRFQPEFVTLTGNASRTSLTYLPNHKEDFFQQLDKSYTLVHEEYKTQLWESLWSPYLSLMGLVEPVGQKLIRKGLIDDGEEVHVCMGLSPGDPALRIDLDNVFKPGKRWLHGWVMAQQPYIKESIVVIVNSGERNFGTIDVIPQTAPLRWQEFWLSLGNIPRSVTFSWKGPNLLWGDLRLISETVWSDDLTRVLVGVIERKLGSKSYGVQLRVRQTDRVYNTVLQHPGLNVDSIDIPPVRLGYDQALVVTYGLAPKAVQKSDGVDFRLLMRDYPLGKKYLIFEDSVIPGESGFDPNPRTRRINLKNHSRHLVMFTFEVKAGPAGNTDNDHALWYEARLVQNE